MYDAEYADYLAFLKGQGLCCGDIASIPALDASDLNQPSLAVGDLAGVQTLRRTVTNVTGSSSNLHGEYRGPRRLHGECQSTRTGARRRVAQRPST